MLRCARTGGGGRYYSICYRTLDIARLGTFSLLDSILLEYGGSRLAILSVVESHNNLPQKRVSFSKKWMSSEAASLYQSSVDLLSLRDSAL